MEQLYVNEDVLLSVFQDRQAYQELSDFLNDAIDAEFRKGDEMDCDFIDACTDALEMLQKENGVSQNTLTVLLSQEKFLKAIQKRSLGNTGKYKKLTAVCACAALLLTVGGIYSKTETGASLTKQIGNKLAAIFTVEGTTDLTEETNVSVSAPPVTSA